MPEAVPRVVFDSGTLIAVERGQLTMPSGYDAAIAAITAAELFYGVKRSDPSHHLRRKAFVEAVVSILHVLPFDLATARVYATIAAQLDAEGAAIGVPDTMIAATTLAHGRQLATLKPRHFERVAGLRLVALNSAYNPSAPVFR